MAAPLREYKVLIDGFVGIRPAIQSARVRQHQSWPDLPENRAINDFLVGLSEPQREALAQMLQQARDGGIHDVLAYLNDAINLDHLRLVRDGVELPVEPFGTELYYDRICRREGSAWPEPVEGTA